MGYTQQQLQEIYKSLPEDLKEAIFGVHNAEIIQNISKKNNLHVDQMGELAAETGLVLLGLTRPENYIKNLGNRLNIDLKQAREIAMQVNIEIFSKVKESLKKIHGIGQTIQETPKEEMKPENSASPQIKIPRNSYNLSPESDSLSNENSTPEPENLEKNKGLFSRESELSKLSEKHESKLQIPEFEIIAKPNFKKEGVVSEEKKLNEKSAANESVNINKDSTPVNSEVPLPKYNFNSSSEIKVMPQDEKYLYKEPAPMPIPEKPIYSNKNTATPAAPNTEFQRFSKQTTEIKIPQKPEIPLKRDEYPSGDPYREPI